MVLNKKTSEQLSIDPIKINVYFDDICNRISRKTPVYKYTKVKRTDPHFIT